MKRKEFKRKVDGGILEIPLWGNYGFAYAKYIDGPKHSELGRLIDLIKVYNHKAEHPILDLTLLKNKPYFINGMLVAGLPSTISKGLWKVVGKLDIEAKDLIAPDFKKEHPSNGKWMILREGNIEEYANETDIQNLELYAYRGTGNVEIRLTLAFMKMNGDDPKQHLDFTDERISSIYSELYK